MQECLYYIAIFQGSVGKKACGAALHASVQFRFIEVLSRITATRFQLDVPNKFPSAVRHVDRVSLEKSKGGRLQCALAYREKQGEEREERGEGIACAEELCSQTFDRLALLSSTQPFSIDSPAAPQLG